MKVHFTDEKNGDSGREKWVTDEVLVPWPLLYLLYGAFGGFHCYQVEDSSIIVVICQRWQFSVLTLIIWKCKTPNFFAKELWIWQSWPLISTFSLVHFQKYWRKFEMIMIFCFVYWLNIFTMMSTCLTLGGEDIQ